MSSDSEDSASNDILSDMSSDEELEIRGDPVLAEIVGRYLQTPEAEDFLNELTIYISSLVQEFADA